VVKEHGNDVEWEEIKERVRDTFLMAKDRVEKREGMGGHGRKVKWQVWVMGPEEEDEDW